MQDIRCRYMKYYIIKGRNDMGKSDYDPEIHHRRSIRMASHNYASSGAYFVTICAKDRTPLFDRPELRLILEEAWHFLPQHFPDLKLDEFVIMPDHVHFILWLDSDLSEGIILGDVIGAYKSLTCVDWLKYIKANGLNERGKFWQDDYFERIIRDEYELAQQRAYVHNNPLKHDTSS